MALTNDRVDLLSAPSVLTGEPSGRPAEPQVGRRECSHCEGHGKIAVQSRSSRWDDYDLEECDECEGSGVLEAA